MADPLITEAEATAAWAGFSALDSAERSALIASASAAVEAACFRPLGLATYRETLRPGRSRMIRLKARPIVTLDRLACDPLRLVRITGPSTASRATATVSATTLTLASTTSGVVTSAAITWASHATLADLEAAVEAVTGWSAEVTAEYSTWATADLELEPGAYGCLDPRSSLDLWGFTRDLGDYLPDFEQGQVEIREPFADGFRFPDRTWGGDPRRGNVLAEYTAGYATANAPPELKRASILCLKTIRDLGSVGGIYKSETLGARSFTLADLPGDVQTRVGFLVAKHIDYGV